MAREDRKMNESKLVKREVSDLIKMTFNHMYGAGMDTSNQDVYAFIISAYKVTESHLTELKQQLGIEDE
jgi:hypothetical protein